MIHKGIRAIHAMTLVNGTVASDESNGAIAVKQDDGASTVWAVDDAALLRFEPMPQDQIPLPSITLMVHKKIVEENWPAKHLSINWDEKRALVTVVHADTWSQGDLVHTQWSPFMVKYPGLDKFPVTKGFHQFTWNESASCWDRR